ncbi:fimbrial assembly protein [Acidipila rosea]|uniref:Type IV pilus assembly protein PilN n=1 Tax=Acidipila rosea TaxID=768535 RepID=A0A4R1LBX2_9BACT|nr:fimbrial assembly protein [Acidipila rosea]TCK75996.1 type IV pilus assembly protein PilN [Acidipila rosea]
MKITVNLASRPYVELRPVYTQLRIWIGVLALAAIPLWLLLHTEQKKAAVAVARVSRVETAVNTLEKRQQSYQALMKQPKNAAVLTQSSFLNGLFRRKAFSWTATMTDLETVLPGGVQVLSIDPVIAKDGHVTIRMRVSGQRDRALDLIRNLEKSKHFASPRLAGESLASSGEGTNGRGTVEPVASGLVNMDILADYKPLSYADKQTPAGLRKEALPSPAEMLRQMKKPAPKRRKK